MCVFPFFTPTPQAHVHFSTPCPRRLFSPPSNTALALLSQNNCALAPICGPSAPHVYTPYFSPSPPPLPFHTSTTPWTKTTGSPAWTPSRNAPCAPWGAMKNSRIWWLVPTFARCPARTFRAWRSARKGGRRRAAQEGESKKEEEKGLAMSRLGIDKRKARR